MKSARRRNRICSNSKIMIREGVMWSLRSEEFKRRMKVKVMAEKVVYTSSKIATP